MYLNNVCLPVDMLLTRSLLEMSLLGFCMNSLTSEQSSSGHVLTVLINSDCEELVPRSARV